MKRIVIALIGLLLFGKGYAQHFLRASDRKLDSLYRVLVEEPESVQKQQEFLDCFPDNFEEFQKTYGYNPRSSKKSSMYAVGEEHVYKGLAQLGKLPDTLYYTKLINLSIGGRWRADAVSALQETVRKKALKKPRLLFGLLLRYSQEKIYSFWYFYFNSLYPLEGGIPATFLQMKSDYPKVYQELLRGFKDSDGQVVCDEIL